ncbi:MAG: diguanylate cyclase, partial [Pseudomonadota bacterium]
IFFSVRDIAYLYYVLYVLSLGVTVFHTEWLASSYFWTNSDEPSTVWMFAVCLIITYLIVALFVRALLNTPQHLPRWDRFFSSVMLVSVCLCAVLLFIPDVFTSLPKNHLPFYATQYLSLIGTALVLTTGILAWFRQVNAAKYFLFAWSLFLLSVFINNIRLLGAIPSNLFTTNIVFIGAILEIIFLSFSLADRINAMRRETIQMQNTLNEKLEQEVATRTEELNEANLALVKLSNEDGLTGLFNRRYLDTTLAHEWQRLQRRAMPLSLIMSDIDDFKKYNDTYGHQAGDECLQQVAQALQKHVKRPYDVAARYGGEEFAILLPQTDLADAQHIAKLMRLEIEHLQIPHEQSRVKNVVSMSFGVASLIPEHDQSTQALIKLADTALYQSKEDGRDQISTSML